MSVTESPPGDDKTSTVRFEAFDYDSQIRPEYLQDLCFGGENTVAVDLADGITDRSEGDIAAALDTIFHAPAFDHVDGEEISAALGGGIIAVIIDGDEEIIATNPDFDSEQEVTRGNAPVRVGDTVPNEIPNGDDHPLTMQDWPTGGPLFETIDGEPAQLENFDILRG